MNKKQIIYMIFTLMLGFTTVPAAHADVDVVVKYVVINHGHHYREPMNYRYGSRLYSNNSRFKTYSNRDLYSKYSRDRYVKDRYRVRRGDHRYYSEPRQYRNSYYYGHRDTDRRYRNDRYRNDRSNHHRYDRNDNHRRNYVHQQDSHRSKYRSQSGNRVHININ